MNNIEEKLKDAKLNLLTKNKLTNKLDEIEKSIEEQEKELVILKQSLEKEYKDFHKLETMSFSNFIVTILGKKEEKLDKEKREYLEAKFKLEEAKKIIELNKIEKENLQERIIVLDEAEKRYQELIQEKRILIKALSDDYDEKKIEKIEEKIDEYLRESVEISEALEANKVALKALEKALSYFNSASSWGIYDSLGGGMLSSIIKHGEIDSAKSAMDQFLYFIKNLQRELSDISLQLPFEEVENIKNDYFFDVFLDNIFTDISVQGEIDKAIRKLKKCKVELLGLEVSLADKEIGVIEVIDEEKKKLIEMVEAIKI